MTTETRRIRGGVLSLGDAFKITIGVGAGLWLGGVLFYATALGFSFADGFKAGLAEVAGSPASGDAPTP